MKITKKYLKQLIREMIETEQSTNEAISSADLKRDILYQKSEVYSEIALSLLTAIAGAIKDERDAKALQDDHDRAREKFTGAGREAVRRAKEARRAQETLEE